MLLLEGLNVHHEQWSGFLFHDIFCDAGRKHFEKASSPACCENNEINLVFLREFMNTASLRHRIVDMGGVVDFPELMHEPLHVKKNLSGGYEVVGRADIE